MDTVPENRESSSTSKVLDETAQSSSSPDDIHNAPEMRPTVAQRRYLERGLEQPGGKLPLFDREGREVAKKTIEACLAHGWAEPWTLNPIKPDWLVCRLTAAGYRVLGRTPPDRKAI